MTWRRIGALLLVLLGALAPVATAGGAESSRSKGAAHEGTQHHHQTKGPHVLAIPGTGDPSHLLDNLAAATLPLTPADLTRLNTITPTVG